MIKTAHAVKSKRTQQPVPSLTRVFSIFALKVTIPPNFSTFIQAGRRRTGPLPERERKHAVSTSALGTLDDRGVEMGPGVRLLHPISYQGQAFIWRDPFAQRL